MGSIHPVERILPGVVLAGVLLVDGTLWVFAGLWYGVGACLLLAPEAVVCAQAVFRKDGA